MLIRSQDKMNIINLDNVKLIRANEYYSSVEDPNMWKVSVAESRGVSFLGEYSSKDKAIKVLDMICETYDKYSKKYVDFTDVENNRWYKSVFEMPDDENIVITDENGVIVSGN